MIEFYPEIKLLHVATVLASGGLFLLRGIAVQARLDWGMATPVRFLSYGIDTLLLSAALTLLAILPSVVFSNGWLWVKLALLIVYIVLGSFALKRAPTRRARAVCLIAALLAYAAIFAIARTHDPLGAVNAFLS